MRGEIFWQKMPRERKVSSVPNQEETAILLIDYPKFSNCEVWMKTKQHEPGVVLDLTSARSGLHFPQNSADDNILNSRWTKKRARWFREFGYRAIRWKQKETSGTMSCLQRFHLPSQKPETIHRDNSKDFIKVCRVSHWHHDTSASHRSETNGVAERAVRIVKEGTLPHKCENGTARKMWDRVTECSCYLRNGRDKNDRWQDSIRGERWQIFWRTLDSFWNIGWVHPKHSERQVERSSVRKENVEGRFLSYVLRARGGSSGYFMIADCEDLQESKASDIYVKRFKSQDLFGKEEYGFPYSNGISRFSDRARPSSIAEGRFEQQHDVETEEGDKKGSNKEFS